MNASKRINNRRSGSLTEESIVFDVERPIVKKEAFLRKVIKKVEQNWFLVGLVLTILIAKQRPEIGMKAGPLRPEITVKYGAVILIFFLSGISLEAKQLKSAAKNAPLHILIQGISLGLVPSLAFFVWRPLLLRLTAASWIVDGILAVACMPPPVSSAVILTKAVGGNEAAAILNSALGSFLGIFLTPFLLMLTISTTKKSTAKLETLYHVFRELVATVMLPLLCGQVVRRQTTNAIIDQFKSRLGLIGQSALLLIVYTTFCDAFSAQHNNVEYDLFILLIFIIVFIQLCIMALAFILAFHFARFLPIDVIACVFCASHKSLTLGVPVLRLVFASYPSLSLLTTPLLIYHPTQILLGGLFVPAAKAWLHRSLLRKDLAQNGSLLHMEEGEAIHQQNLLHDAHRNTTHDKQHHSNGATPKRRASIDESSTFPLSPTTSSSNTLIRERHHQPSPRTSAASTDQQATSSSIP